MPVPRGMLPSMHSFRHTVASRALLAGESIDEVAFLLGHRDATVTRTVYVREVADARRRAMRRSACTRNSPGRSRSPSMMERRSCEKQVDSAAYGTLEFSKRCATVLPINAIFRRNRSHDFREIRT